MTAVHEEGAVNHNISDLNTESALQSRLASLNVIDF